MSDVRGVTEVDGIKEYQYFAGGEWRGAEDGKLFDVYRPYDRGLYAHVAAGGRPEAKLAVDAAAKAFPAWSQTTPADEQGCSSRQPRSSSAVAPRLQRFWPLEPAVPSPSPHSSKTL